MIITLPQFLLLLAGLLLNEGVSALSLSHDAAAFSSEAAKKRTDGRGRNIGEERGGETREATPFVPLRAHAHSAPALNAACLLTRIYDT